MEGLKKSIRGKTASRTRETILLGDDCDPDDRNLRRDLYFTEPNSGRRTLRSKTGHLGGRSGTSSNPILPLRSSRLPPPSTRLDKICHVRTDASNGKLGDPYTPREIPTEIPRNGRGSSAAARSHLKFAHNLRGGRTARPGASGKPWDSVRVDKQEWRRVTGFSPEKLQQLRRPLTAKPTPTSNQIRQFDSETEREKIGFVDRGLRKVPWSPNWYEKDDAFSQTAADLQIDQQQHEGEDMAYEKDGSDHAKVEGAWYAVPVPAGGPPGPKALVDWRDWHREMGARVEKEQVYFAEATEQRREINKEVSSKDWSTLDPPEAKATPKASSTRMTAETWAERRGPHAVPAKQPSSRRAAAVPATMTRTSQNHCHPDEYLESIEMTGHASTPLLRRPSSSSAITSQQKPLVSPVKFLGKDRSLFGMGVGVCRPMTAARVAQYTARTREAVASETREDRHRRRRQAWLNRRVGAAGDNHWEA